MHITEQAWNARHYASAGAFVPRLGAELVDLLAPQPGERILDLGCGTGQLTSELSRRGARVFGLDASPDMVSQARRQYPELTFQVGDGQRLSFESEFDAVFSNATLHWMPRADDVASGVARALRPGGRFVAEFGGVDCVRSVRQALRDALGELGAGELVIPGWYFPSVAEHVARLDRAGLFVRSASWFERPTRVEGEQGLRDWLELFCLPLLRNLGDRRPALVENVERRCRPRLFRDGAWWLDYTRLRAVATKPV